MKRTKLEAEQTKQDILNAALEIFDEKNYDNATIDNIAKRAGVTRGAVYWHFKNKFDIFSVLTEKLLGKFFNNVIRAIDSSKEDSIQKIIKFLSDYFDKLLTDMDFLKYRKIVEYRISSNEEAVLIKMTIGEFQNILSKKLRTIIENGQEKNEIRKDLSSDFLIISIIGWIKGFEELTIFSDDSWGFEAKKELIIDNIIKTMQVI